VRASDEAAKHAILQGTDRIATENLLAALRVYDTTFVGL
jgi:hypothetical protein